MCEQCVAKTKTYGAISPSYNLIQATQNGNEMKKGDFGIVHFNDPDYIFPESVKSMKDPTFGFTDEQSDNMTEEQYIQLYEFQDYVSKLREYLDSDPYTGYCLVKDCIKVGYNPKETEFLSWLAHKMALLIENNPNPLTDDEQYLQDAIKNGYNPEKDGNLIDWIQRQNAKTIVQN